MRSQRELSQKYALILIAVLALLFANTVPGLFLWDDQQFIVDNFYLRDWKLIPRFFTENLVAGAGIQSQLYRPFQLLTHWVDFEIWGLRPWGHRLTNLLLHLAGSVALFFAVLRIIRRRRSSQREGHAELTAFLAVLLYAMHPLQSGVVGYVSGRGDLLLVLFSATAALALPQRAWLAWIFSVLAVFSKESAALLPLFLLGYEKLLSSPSQSWAELLRRRWTFFLVPAFYVALRLSVLDFGGTLNFYRESNVLTEHYSYRFFTYLSTLAQGIWLWIWPVGIHHERRWLVYAGWDAPVIAGGVILLALVFSAWRFRKKIPMACFGLLWFLLATLPTSNLIVLINALIYDHWFLVPGVGMVFVAVALFDRLSVRRGVVLAAVLFPLLSILTLEHNRAWTTPERLYQRILRYEPQSIKILTNLGMTYDQQGEHEKAKDLYQQAITLGSTYPETYHNLAMNLAGEKRWSEALALFRQAQSRGPRFYQALEREGDVLMVLGQKQQAIEAYEKALRIFENPVTEAKLNRARLVKE